VLVELHMKRQHELTPLSMESIPAGMSSGAKRR
jgi:hypothetical protein